MGHGEGKPVNRSTGGPGEGWGGNVRTAGVSGVHVLNDLPKQKPDGVTTHARKKTRSRYGSETRRILFSFLTDLSSRGARISRKKAIPPLCFKTVGKERLKYGLKIRGIRATRFPTMPYKKKGTGPAEKAAKSPFGQMVAGR